MRTRTLMIGIAMLAIAACAPVTPSPSQPPAILPTGEPTAEPTPPAEPTPTPVAQGRDCGNLNPEFCAEAIAAVIRYRPQLGDSPLAVTATLDPDRPTQRGGSTSVLVAFAPIGGETDMWSPGIYVATQPMMSSDWSVEVWRDGPLPDHFLALMRASGLEPGF